MSKQLLTLVVFIFVVQICLAQNSIEEYVRSSTVSISGIESDSSDFEDMELLGHAIGDSKIVMLGEQDHGDAPTFTAKTRIIKYLHEVKGFNVLAFESDFFALNEGWGHLEKKDDDISYFLKQNVFPIWTHCSACSDLFYNYIPSTFHSPTPLNISGFDDQLILNYSTSELWKKLDSVLTSLNLPISKDDTYHNEILPLLESVNLTYGKQSKADTVKLNRCLNYCLKIKEQSSGQISKSEFWSMIIQNLVQLYMQRLNYERKENMDSTRDYQMAENLKWLCQVKYPDEKIIVWAANAHIIKDNRSEKRNNGFRIKSMGRFFTHDEQLGQKTYIIGFNSYEGMAGRLGGEKYKLEKPMKFGFENWIDSNRSYAFVDFKKFNRANGDKSAIFNMKALGHISMKLEWTKLFDGIFFIRTMYPCESIKK